MLGAKQAGVPNDGFEENPLHSVLNIRDFKIWYDEAVVRRQIVKITSVDVMSRVPLRQSRSQGLSSLPPLAVGRKTLVAAGHMTTQNLGGKKIC